jgi:hypothetical protein
VSILATVLFFLVGLHLPKAFTLLYVALLVCAIQVRQLKPLTNAALPAYWRWSFLGLSLFSIVYLVIMLYWGFASPVGSGLLDCISALVLPAGCFWVGLRLPLLGRATTTKLLLAYSLGSLLYVVAALLVARHPWWALDQIFTLVIPTPWGIPKVVNVRSIEQNGIIALTMIPAALFLAVKPSFPGRLGAFAIGGAVLLGLHAVLSLNGRLGFLALLLALLPLLAVAWHQRLHWPKALTAGGLGGVVLIGSLIARHPSVQRLLAGGYCDERFGMYAGFLQHLGQGLLGGRQIVVTSLLCDGKTAFDFGGGTSGYLTMVHNVVLDIYNDAGMIPVVLLLSALLPALASIFWGFWILFARGTWDWQWSVRWSWFVVLLTQWLFQPLLYGDGLLYYLSFLVLGLLAAEFALVYRKGNSEPQPQSTLSA